MLDKTTTDFRKFFLLAFTRELIRNTKTEAIYELQERLKNQEKIKETENKKENFEIKIPFMTQNLSQRRMPMILRIPEPRLPPHLQYLRPYAVEMEMDLGKLNPFLKDPAVREIECHGEENPLIVRGQMGQKSTSVILNNDEINEIINTIAITAKMPKEEGLFHAVIGKIIFSAIISENGSKFILKKI